MDVYPKGGYMTPYDGCEPFPIEGARLAHAYVPFQRFCGVMPPMASLCSGTVFAELYSPYSKREFVNLEPQKCLRPYLERRIVRNE